MNLGNPFKFKIHEFESAVHTKIIRPVSSNGFRLDVRA